ncbi:helix-turn-helix transcriptional regulator [Paenibacillus shunpengii]|uniref:Helix-turn-helix transcriptional regulator n=1 Tax=Paenibacillus shunpengii TaxID=2054424 RepID=A0ABW5SUF9_9BACL
MSAPKEKSTRQRILHMLKVQGPLSAREITAELGITEMAVRRHLATLEKDGHIATSEIRQTAGRPSAVFGLTDSGEGLFPKTYPKVTLDLLGELAEESGEEMIDLLFERRRNKLHQRYASEMKGKDLAGRVQSLARIQNDNGYMTELMEVEEGFVLKEYNCPISEVADAYGQACRCELELFQSLLEVSVSRTECLAKGGRCCTYKISSCEN